MNRINSLIPGNRFLPVILIVVSLVCANSAVFFANRTLVPITSANGLLPYAPYGYSGPTIGSGTTLDAAAAYDACYALDAYVTSVILKGTIPFWNPYQGLGQPLLSNYFSAALYPVNWLHFLLPPAWWDMVYLLNWLLAAVFLYMYLRLFGLDVGASLVGSIAVFASGYFQWILALREVLAVAAWWPLLLYGVERTVREPTWRSRHWVLALGVYCSITGGQPEVAFLSLFVVLVYALIRLAKEPRKAFRGLIALAPGSLAGLMLTAPLWINFAHYAFNNYSSHPAGSSAGEIHLGFNTLATYFFPYIYGRLYAMPYGKIVGWDWVIAPGWFPAVGLFLAVVSLSLLKGKTRWGIGFLWATAAIMIAKIWGIPGVGVLGNLPLFEHVYFSKFGGFLPALTLAGLAGYGVFALSKIEARGWIPWLMVWFALVIVVFILGIVPIWPALNGGKLFSGSSRILIKFGGLGLAWCVLGPMGLWWFKYRRPAENGILYALAACGLLLQGAAYASNGYSSDTYVTLSVCCLAVYLSLALVIGLVKKIQLSRLLIASKVVLVALPSLGGAFLAPHGLPLRYNPLTPPPYLGTLAKLQNNNLYRSYSMDSLPHPNFASPFWLTSLDILEAVLPTGTAKFMYSYLDRGVIPLWFAGNVAEGRDVKFTALNEFFVNKRYFDLVGVRYLVTNKDTAPHPVLYSRQGLRAYVPLTQPLEARFPCPTDYLTEIEVYLSTYQKTNPGSVILSVSGPDGTLLRSASVPGANLRNNSFQKFDFSPINGFKDQQLHVRLEFQPEQPGSMIAAWEFSDHPEWGFVFRVLDTTKRLPLIYDDETGVRIWENPQASPRVFLAPEAGVASSWQDALARLKSTSDLTRKVWLDQEPGMESTWPNGKPAGHLLSFHLEPNDMWIKYQANTAGILTVTDSYLEGWRAEIDGVEVPVLRVDGAFRGLRIEEPGVYNVHFRYRPHFWNQSVGIAAVGLAVVVAGSLVGRRENPI